jgi:DNA-binding MarR family transcriptional regulator
MHVATGMVGFKAELGCGAMPRNVALDAQVGPRELFFYSVRQMLRRRDLAFSDLLYELGLDLARWHVLAVARRIDGCTMKEVADFTAVDRTTLTRTVDQLCEVGLIVRESAPEDRRRVRLYLTDEGHLTVERTFEAMRDFDRELLAQIDQEEVGALRAMAAKVLTALMGSSDQALALLDFRRMDEA